MGRRFSPDVRDRGFLMRRLLAAPGEAIPARKTWRIGGLNLDQGNTGRCVAFAWTNWMRCAPILTEAKSRPSEDELYDWAIANDIWEDNDFDTTRQLGTSVRAGAEAVRFFGRMNSYVWSFSLQPALEWVLTRGSVVLGTDWFSSFNHPDPEGIVKITPTAQVVGGHAFLWRGADTRRGLARCSNSWGEGYGIGGDFFIPLRDLETLISRDGEACSAIEQKLQPKKVMPVTE